MTRSGKHVVLFSTADWNWPYWTNKQHMAVQLAARGYHVLYVETVGIRRPRFNSSDLIRIVRRVGRALAPIREMQASVWVLPPLTIPAGDGFGPISKFNTWQVRRRIAQWLRQQRVERPMVWAYHPYLLEVAEALEPTAIIYHCVDDIGAVPGVDRNSYDAAERALLTRADHVFATSPALRDRCAAVAPERTHYFPNVADVDHFAAARRDGPIPPDLAAIPRPRLGYVGVLSDLKLDLDLVERVVSRNADWHWVFIGDEREGQSNPALARLATRPNVHMLGWRPYASLPAYLRGIDIALLPQQINDYTRAMFPMKFFEYLAAGRVVVTTPLPALAEFRDLCRTVTGAEEMIEEIEAILAERRTTSLPVDDAVLRTHSWGARLDAMLAILGS
jgi:glycosyltransferase involved in cell wall biosynthesis